MNMIYLKAICQLGIGNVLRVVIYRLGLKSGFYRWKTPVNAITREPFIVDSISADSVSEHVSLLYFSKHRFSVDKKNLWFTNPWKPNADVSGLKKHWTEIPDFSKTIGDIKTVWEPSRFDWAPKLAWLSFVNNDARYVNQLEFMLREWTESNPTNCGVNWKCGQEASLRVLNVLLSLKLLPGSYELPSRQLLSFFIAHLSRISATTIYAKAQNNNHGTSEAVALYCVGSYLKLYGINGQRAVGHKAMMKGRRLLENRARVIIMNDGSFSQNSVNYHRLMLDTIILCELTRRSHGDNRFSDDFYRKMQVATRWLDSMVDRVSGDTPNLGANDGANFANIEDKPYRDYRPTLKRAKVLFQATNLDIPESDSLLDAYSVQYKRMPTDSGMSNCFFPDGGYAKTSLTRKQGFLIFRYPKYQFRPANCDANHVDIWLHGTNITLDGGSYSYNPDQEDLRRYFGGTASHCTVMFDDRDQMPELSRMLRGAWLHPVTMKYDEASGDIESKYIDYKGAWHERSVNTTETGVIVKDVFGGFTSKAVLRWRLAKEEWQLESDTLKSKKITINITTEELHTTEMHFENNSRYYLDLEEVPVVTVTFKNPAIVVTEFIIN